MFDSDYRLILNRSIDSYLLPTISNGFASC